MKSKIIRQFDIARVEFNQNGWLPLPGGSSERAELTSSIAALAHHLGQPMAGRARTIVEPIAPRDTQQAHPSSLSATYGLDALPFHIDTSHWAVPCRYLILGCVDAGSQSVPTLLVDRRAVLNRAPDLKLARSAVFHIKNGRNSFYSSIVGLDDRFIRYDPGCMNPVSPDGEEALSLFSPSRTRTCQFEFHWSPGDVLLVDNWKVLHGRAPVHEDSQRLLLRSVVK